MKLNRYRLPEETLEYLRNFIQWCYERPFSYGGDASGVDTMLFYWHKAWAFVSGLEHEYDACRLKYSEDCGMNSHNASSFFLSRHPGASEAQVVDAVVAWWKGLDERFPLDVSRHD